MNEEKKPPRPIWQMVVIFFVLWGLLYYGLAAMFPGVKNDHQSAALFFFIALTGMLAGRITWIFR